MPCRAETDAEMLDAANQRIHDLTDKLCRTCTHTLMQGGTLQDDVREWYDAHLEWDRRRREHEEAFATAKRLADEREEARLTDLAHLREVALAKILPAGLSDEEMAALGLQP